MIRFYGIDKPAKGRAGRRVCWRENDAGEYAELADNIVVLDWGTTQLSPVAPKLPRPGASELAKALCLAALDREPTPRRASKVYMRFRQRYVDNFPPNWSLTDLDVRNAIEQIEAEGEAAQREIDKAPKERPPVMTDAGGATPTGVVVWDTDAEGRLIAPKDPDDFAWQSAPLRTDRGGE